MIDQAATLDRLWMDRKSGCFACWSGSAASLSERRVDSISSESRVMLGFRKETIAAMDFSFSKGVMTPSSG